jgi:hypothetical protein
MSKRTNHIPPALKHGIYSGIGLLPGEDPAAFEKFKQELFDEFAPVGRSEEDIVENMSYLKVAETKSLHIPPSRACE